MPRKTKKIARLSGIAKTSESETISTKDSKDVNPDLTTTSVPRRSPRKQGSSQTAPALAPTTKAAVSPKSATKSSEKVTGTVQEVDRPSPQSSRKPKSAVAAPSVGSKPNLQPDSQQEKPVKSIRQSGRKSKVAAVVPEPPVESESNLQRESQQEKPVKSIRQSGRKFKVAAVPEPPIESESNLQPKSQEKRPAKSYRQNSRKSKGAPVPKPLVEPESNLEADSPKGKPAKSQEQTSRKAKVAVPEPPVVSTPIPQFDPQRERSNKSKQGARPGRIQTAPRKPLEPENNRVQHPQEVPTKAHSTPDKVDKEFIRRPETPPVVDHSIESDQERSRHQLTAGNLQELNQKLERSLNPIIGGHSGEERGDEAFHETDPYIEEHYRHKWGYVPPLDEEIVRLIQAVARNPSYAEIMVGITSQHDDFLPGLESRNVASETSAESDPLEIDIRDLPAEEYLKESTDEQASYEQLWKSDKKKCAETTGEALYQRTIMMNLIFRHFVYQLDRSTKQIFDFSVEKTWKCHPMPTKLFEDYKEGEKTEARYLTRPKPDLAICFKRESIIPDGDWRAFPEKTRKLACFENYSSCKSSVFHFLVIEAKNAETSLESKPALYQCLNDASQALHNMYEFLRDAGPVHEKAFYDKVRFFSIVANGRGMIVRTHRPVEVPKEARKTMLVMQERSDYRLKFEFREFEKLLETDDTYSRKSVLKIMRKIFKYATETLSKTISAAAKALAEKLEKDMSARKARTKSDFYTYGQPDPKSLKTSKQTSKQTSKAPSTVGKVAQQELKNFSIDSNATSPTSSGPATPRPPKVLASSPLATAAVKRALDDDDDVDMRDEVRDDRPKKKLKGAKAKEGSLLSPSLSPPSVATGAA